MGSSDPIPGVDPFTASAARVYDYMLGGNALMVQELIDFS